MPGDALWALAACLVIEAVFAPVARIICCWRYRVEFRKRNAQPLAGSVSAGSQSAVRGDIPDDSSEI